MGRRGDPGAGDPGGPPPGSELRSDGELLEDACRRGAAFGVFYERHHQRVYRYFRVRVIDTQVAYDLMAETFAEALIDVDRFDPARGEPLAWLHGIAGNQLRRFARREAVDRRARVRLGMRSGPLGADDAAEIEELIDLTDAKAELRAELSLLPDSTRQILSLRFDHELAYDEIAAELGIPAATVRKRVHRALITMARALGPSPFEGGD